jgi:hypothetical protein
MMMNDWITKLKLNRCERVGVLGIPQSFEADVAKLKQVPLSTGHDALVVFTTSNAAFFTTLERLANEDRCVEGGALLIAYPKKGNPLYPDYVHRDEIFPKVRMDDDGYIYNSPYRFNRMLGLVECFTLLEIKRVAQRKPAKPAHSGADYLIYIPDVEAMLVSDPDVLSIYKALSPSYRKDWAVYLFTTSNESTRAKRFEELKRVLRAGYKNMTLYRQAQKK